jgi:hypothetical protein
MRFLINENTARDLPLLARRLVGPDVAQVSEGEGVLQRAVSTATEGVSFVLWPWGGKAGKAFNRLAEEERLHSHYSRVVRFGGFQMADGPAEQQAQRNPEKHWITAHIARPDGSLEVHGLTFQETDNFQAQLDALRKFVAHHKLRRPGHEYDAINSIRTEDSLPAADGTCTGFPMLRPGDRIRYQINGTSMHTGGQFLSTAQTSGTVGDAIPALPRSIALTVFDGLCVPSKRTVVMPARKHYADDEHPGVAAEDIVKLDVHVIELLPAQIASTPITGAGTDEL